MYGTNALLSYLASRLDDRKGSIYDVELDHGGLSCSVTTTRKTVKQRRTNALIQLRHGRIFWGKNFELGRKFIGSLLGKANLF